MKSSDDDEEELIPPTPTDTSKRSARPGRRRVRKLVEKTFTDGDGFLVSKKEMESCSETDDENEEKEQKKVLTATSRVCSS